MTLATIQRFVISSCRTKAYFEACQRIVSSSSILQNKIVRQTESAHRMCTVHRRFFHDKSGSLKIKLKENEIIPENVSALQIKKRLPRSRNVIKDVNITKHDVSVLRNQRRNYHKSESIVYCFTVTMNDYYTEIILLGMECESFDHRGRVQFRKLSLWLVGSAVVCS